MSDAKKGRIPWNKGLTKETSSSVCKYSAAKKGKPSGMKGKTSWNAGLNKKQQEEYIKSLKDETIEALDD